LSEKWPKSPIFFAQNWSKSPIFLPEKWPKSPIFLSEKWPKIGQKMLRYFGQRYASKECFPSLITVKPGTDVMFFLNIFAKKLAFLTQNKAKI
jgi:hypothetical protein